MRGLRGKEEEEEEHEAREAARDSALELRRGGEEWGEMERPWR